MEQVGKVASVWRYPVKSMAGEALERGFVSYGGLYGDRRYAFVRPSAPDVFPYFTARDNPDMLRHRPRFKDPAAAADPDNWQAVAAANVPVTPVTVKREALAVEVETPAGEVYDVDDIRLRHTLYGEERLELIQADTVLADCNPISLISTQTIDQLAGELDRPLDPRRFRANLYLDLDAGTGFAEDAYVDRNLRIGDRVKIAVTDRDPRCAVIALDPDDARRDKEILQHVSRNHGNTAGVYGVILAEGVVKPGDAVYLL